MLTTVPPCNLIAFNYAKLCSLIPPVCREGRSLYLLSPVVDPFLLKLPFLLNHAASVSVVVFPSHFHIKLPSKNLGDTRKLPLVAT